MCSSNAFRSRESPPPQYITLLHVCQALTPNHVGFDSYRYGSSLTYRTLSGFISLGYENERLLLRLSLSLLALFIIASSSV